MAALIISERSSLVESIKKLGMIARYTTERYGIMIFMDSQNKKKTHFKGLLGELEFSLYLIKKGWNVFTPLDHNSRIDLVAEKEGVFKKIQIKYCTLYKGCLRIELEHPMRNTKPYSLSDIDDIGVYDSINHGFYLIPLSEILPRKEIWIRVNQLKGNQKKNINWGRRYRI